jgi:3-deoxy-manno-octulosonate cytidylyltransferase (CMP-KDO synthetase)
MKNVEVLVVLPLRLASQRIPRKVLADIGGLALGARTFLKTLRTFEHETRVKVCAAVDSVEVRDALLKQIPAELCPTIYLTDPELPSGTDRVSAAVAIFRREEPRVKLKGVVNVQGDMPFVGRAGLWSAIDYFLNSSASELESVGMITLSQPFPQAPKYDDPGAVKVLSDREGRAIYFSRFPIPYSRVAIPKQSGAKKTHDKALGDLHIGVYGYTLPVLARFCGHAPVPMERCESLEQLRALWLGIPILVIPTDVEAEESFRGVDTPADLRWAQSFARRLEPSTKSKVTRKLRQKRSQNRSQSKKSSTKTSTQKKKTRTR